MNGLRDQLKKIESQMKDGNFVDADGNIPAGQDEIKSLMERCWRWTEIVLERYAFALPLLHIVTDTNHHTAKEKSWNPSRSNTTDFWRSGISSTVCPSPRLGHCEKQTFSDSSGNSIALTRLVLMATLLMPKAKWLISTHRGYVFLHIMAIPTC